LGCPRLRPWQGGKSGYRPIQWGLWVGEMSHKTRNDSLIARVAVRSQRVKTAGEVRFIKDRGSDDKNWGWGVPGPEKRKMDPDFKFDARKLQPLARTLRSTLMSMGHALSAYDSFTRLKSAALSPDGNLGGRGYIQKIAEMRRAFMNVVEALSSLSDTLYDEIHAPHWSSEHVTDQPREREQVQEIMEDVEEIKADPEDWAEGEEAEMDEEQQGKKASRMKQASTGCADPLVLRVAARHQARSR